MERNMVERADERSHRLPAQRQRMQTVLVAGQPVHARQVERARRESWQEQTFIVMRNDLTVIRGQAQLMKRALDMRDTADSRAASARLDAIIAAVDQASIELQHWQAVRQSPHTEV